MRKIICLLILAGALSQPLWAQIFKLGTLAPQGSPYYDVVMAIASQWKAASDGKVTLQVYPGGVSGAEPDMVRKMKIGQLDAASLTAMGVFLIEPSFLILQVPGMFNSYEELGYCRNKMTPYFEGQLEKQGFQALNYSDLGGCYFFTKKPVNSISELKKLKICVFANNSRSKAMWAKAGFTTVDLNTSEVLSSLQIGLIDGFVNTPILVASMQWFGVARYMTDVRYGYAQGMTVIRKEKWNALDPGTREKLGKIAAAVVDSTQPMLQGLEKMAIDKMKSFGLRVNKPADPDSWLATLRNIYPQIRDDLLSPDAFDQALRFREEFRGKK
jgi:TRAP-type transport system periplasmic protein